MERQAAETAETGRGRDRKGGFLYRGGDMWEQEGGEIMLVAPQFVWVPVCARMCVRICSSQEANSCKNPFPPPQKSKDKTLM